MCIEMNELDIRKLITLIFDEQHMTKFVFVFT